MEYVIDVFTDLGLELRIVFIVHQIDVLLSDKRIFIGSESLYYIRGFMYFVGRTGTVSYTHLDVYKRQGFFFWVKRKR